MQSEIRTSTDIREHNLNCLYSGRTCSASHHSRHSRRMHSKNKTPVLGNAKPVLGEKVKQEY